MGKKRNEELCTATVEPPALYCWWHDPEKAEERSRNASKAARSKTDVEIGTIKRRLKEVAEGVLNGSVEKGKGSVAFQGFGVLIRAIEVERKVKEQEEVLERIEMLEKAQNTRGGYQWR